MINELYIGRFNSERYGTKFSIKYLNFFDKWNTKLKFVDLRNLISKEKSLSITTCCHSKSRTNLVLNLAGKSSTFSATIRHKILSPSNNIAHMILATTLLRSPIQTLLNRTIKISRRMDGILMNLVGLAHQLYILYYIRTPNW